MTNKQWTYIALFIAFLAGGAWLITAETDGGTRTTAGIEASTATEAGAMVEVRLPETLSAQAEIGKRGFEANCAVCHGENASGRQGIGPPLVHKIYEPSHHGDAAFLLAAQNGVRAHHWNFGSMMPVDGVTPAEVKAITAYVRELQRANGIN